MIAARAHNIHRAKSPEEAVEFFSLLEAGELPVFIDCSRPHFGPNKRRGKLNGLVPAGRLIRIIGLPMNDSMETYRSYDDNMTRLAQRDVGWHHDAKSVRSDSFRQITVIDMVLGVARVECVSLKPELTDNDLLAIKSGEKIQGGAGLPLEIDDSLYAPPYYTDTLKTDERLFIITNAVGAQAHNLTTLGDQRVTINQPYVDVAHRC